LIQKQLQRFPIIEIGNENDQRFRVGTHAFRLRTDRLESPGPLGGPQNATTSAMTGKTQWTLTGIVWKAVMVVVALWLIVWMLRLSGIGVA
jgi:hypothetical protein